MLLLFVWLSAIRGFWSLANCPLRNDWCCWELHSDIKLPVFTDYRPYRSVGGWRSLPEHCASSFFPFTRASATVGTLTPGEASLLITTEPYRRRSRFSSKLNTFHFFSSLCLSSFDFFFSDSTGPPLTTTTVGCYITTSMMAL